MTLKLTILALLVLCGFTLLAIVLYMVREPRDKDGHARVTSGISALGPYRPEPHDVAYTRYQKLHKPDPVWLGDAIIVTVNVLTAILVVLVGMNA